MKGRSVVAASLAAAVAVVGIASIARLAQAAPPAGFKCGKGGKKNVAQERCDCPAGKRPGRSADDEAVCQPKPKPVVGTCPNDMVLVPGGTFQMGSPEGVGSDNERPQHQVKLSSYCIDRTEVTVTAYAACKTCKPAVYGSVSGACNGSRADRQDHPVNCVSWVDADTYCRSREVGKRLPTEPEWEFAARGPKARTYPWGEDEPSATLLNMGGKNDGYEQTAPVGTFKAGASPFGALDLAGNVWEWVADEYVAYDAGSVKDPAPATTTTAAAHKHYSLRGGGWLNVDPPHVRAANRSRWVAPFARDSDLGFRCAREVL